MIITGTGCGGNVDEKAVCRCASIAADRSRDRRDGGEPFGMRGRELIDEHAAVGHAGGVDSRAIDRVTARQSRR